MIHQEITFKSAAEELFKALTTTRQFSEVTDAQAEINANLGSPFSCFDGMITGMNIEVLPNKRLVQAWRVSNWEPGIYSIVKFEFEKLSPSETKLTFDQTGFPEEHRDHLDQGWHHKYWEPLKTYMNSR